MATLKKISDVPVMNDGELAKFWESHEPEDFEEWKEGEPKSENAKHEE